jgi:hypothetical protein
MLQSDLGPRAVHAAAAATAACMPVPVFALLGRRDSKITYQT